MQYPGTLLDFLWSGLAVGKMEEKINVSINCFMRDTVHIGTKFMSLLTKYDFATLFKNVKMHM